MFFSFFLLYYFNDLIFVLFTANQLAPTVPETIFCAFELSYAIFAAVLICSSFADRLKLVPTLIFISIWHLMVYCPVAHSIWHPEGFLNKAGFLDFAGGTVVHVSSGTSGLIFAMIIGSRWGNDLKTSRPHNFLYSFMGACMLWIGWCGSTAGKSYASNSDASMTLLVTQIAASASALSWLTVQWIQRGKPSVLGVVSGTISGLVCISPAGNICLQR